MAVNIIDGVVASGKTTLLKEIQKKILNDKYSKMIITEHLTERFFEGKNLRSEECSQFLTNFLKNISFFHELHKKGPFASKERLLLIYVERLFLTFMSRGLLSEEFFKNNEKLLKQLDIQQFLLVIPEKEFRERIISTLKYRNDNWRQHLENLGGLDTAITLFKNQQNKMIYYAEKMKPFVKTTFIENSCLLTDICSELFS